MINNIPCPFCQSIDINTKEIIWVSFNQENEGLVEIMNYCQSCKNEYPVLTEFKFEITKQDYSDKELIFRD